MKLKNIFILLMAIFTLNTVSANSRTITTAGTVELVKQKKKRKSKSGKIKRTTSDSGDYYNGHKIYTGPRGGRYYINKNGNKTYI